jgi:hypothetical protein
MAKWIGNLLGDAMAESAGKADPDDPEFVAELPMSAGVRLRDSCGRS